VADRKFAIVGFSLGSEVLCAELRSLIESVKRRSLNGSVAILVGGPAFSAMPERVADVGADGWAADAAKAVALAESLVMHQQLAAGGRG
jgi:methanogenic corrinoid protein MtbC1